MVGRPSQARSGIARNLARAVRNSVAHGQRAGRWSVVRRAEWVSRPTRLNSRRRTVLAVMIPAPRPSLAVQRAMLWAMTCTASQAPLAANFPSRSHVSPGASAGSLARIHRSTRPVSLHE